MDKLLEDCLLVLRNQYKISDCSVHPLAGGLINKTFLIYVAGSPKYVLQQLNRQFKSSVTNLVYLVSEHLLSKGIDAPQLVMTESGKFVVNNPNGNWRLLRFIDGFSKVKISSVEESKELARVLGVFHSSVQDCKGIQGKERKKRGAKAQLEKLFAVLEKFPNHSRKRDVRNCANAVTRRLESLPPIACYPEHLLHGDPKVSNFLFSNETPTVKCMIDFDTVGQSELGWELADAFRSWCNLSSEDQALGVFDVKIFESAIYSYLNVVKDLFPKEEIFCSLPVTAHIFLELSMRFLIDAIEEKYFGWNPEIFEDASSHNLTRAWGQLTACESLMDNWSEANQIILNL